MTEGIIANRVGAANGTSEKFPLEVQPVLNVPDYILTLDLDRTKRTRLEKIEDQAIGPDQMAPTTRAVVAIPAHHTEMNLGRTLGEYVKQTAFLESSSNPTFEVLILINGLGNVDLASSRAYQDAVAFRGRDPSFPLVICSSNYPVSENRMGVFRRDVVALALRRALAAPGVDVENLIVVSNDADLQKLPPNYISHMIQRFTEMQSLAVMTGFIDYPHEDLDSEHVFLTVQRFIDVLELIRRRRDGVIILRAGNTAVRASRYVEAGGFRGHSRSRPFKPLYDSLKRNREEVLFDERGEGMNIVTSPRRQLMALRAGRPQAYKHMDFGGSDDIAGMYRVNPGVLQIPEHSTKYTSRDFRARLQAELDNIYRSQITSSGNRTRSEKEARLAAAVLGIKINFVRMSQARKESKGITNVNITHELEICDITRLKAAISKHHNRF